METTQDEGSLNLDFAPVKKKTLLKPPRGGTNRGWG